MKASRYNGCGIDAENVDHFHLEMLWKMVRKFTKVYDDSPESYRGGIVA